MVSEDLKTKILSGETKGNIEPNAETYNELDEKELIESFAPFSEWIARGSMSHTQTFPDLKEVSRPASKACRAIMKIARKENKTPTECIDAGCQAVGIEVSELMEALGNLIHGISDRKIEPIKYQEFKITGIEAREFTVRSGSNTSARINVPAEWIGKRVIVIPLE